MLKIRNEEIFGVEGSIIASGYPMELDLPEREQFDKDADALRYWLKKDNFAKMVRRATYKAKLVDGKYDENQEGLLNEFRLYEDRPYVGLLLKDEDGKETGEVFVAFESIVLMDKYFKTKEEVLEVMGEDVFKADHPNPARAIRHYKRGLILGNAKDGSGHDCALKGMGVHFDVMYPQYWTPQFQRYHFADVISSNSKMHRITRMDVEKCCNKYVTNIAIENLQGQIDHYNIWVSNKKKTIDANGISVEDWNEELYKRFMKVVANIPAGLEQFMRVTTSYLQLKTMYTQRKGHKLKEDWGSYCAWCETLPHFVEFALKGKRIFTDENGEPLKSIYDWR